MSPICLIGIILILAVLHYYLKQYLAVKGLKGVTGKFPYPFVGNVLDFRTKFLVLSCIHNYVRKYGRVLIAYKVYTPYIVVADCDVMNTIMCSQKLIEKDTIYTFFHRWLGTGLLTSSGRKWMTHRKLITPTFHFKILKSFTSTFESVADVLIQKLAEVKENEPFDVFPFITLYSLDIICETALGTKINAQTNADDAYVSAVRDLLNLVVERTTHPLKLTEWMYRLSSDYRKSVRLTKFVHSHTDKIIQSRKRIHADGKVNVDMEDEYGSKVKIAFLDMLIQGRIDGLPLTDEEIREEVDTFMFEGHDTTSSAISFALYCLSLNPDVQQKALEEVTRIFGVDKSRQASYDDLQEMHYLETVIKETLRLYPSVPAFARIATEDLHCDVGTIKRGSAVFLAPFTMHRLEHYFPDPEKFIPERFSPENANNIKPFSYVPFSGGYRNCIGQKFAMLDMKSVLSRVIRNFEILPVPGFEPVVTLEIILKSDNGVKIMLRKRA